MASVVALLIVSCGVNTSSSTAGFATQSSSSSLSSSLTFGSSTSFESVATSSSSSSTQTVSSSSSSTPSSAPRFMSIDALYDANACDEESYSVVTYSPSSGANPLHVTLDGLWIEPEPLESSLGERRHIWLYYRSPPNSSLLNQQGVSTYIKKGVFRLSYDIAWSDGSIEGVDNMLYIKVSDPNEISSCYRAILSSAIASEIEVTKVYR